VTVGLLVELRVALTADAMVYSMVEKRVAMWVDQLVDVTVV
jgi:hypothetical protein